QSEAEAKLAREVEAKTSAEARAEADATARIEAESLADNAQQALVAAQTQTQQAAQEQSEAEAKLAREVEAKTSAEARAEADATARIEAESLAAELTVEKERIENEIEERLSAFTDASAKAESLSVELESARNAADNEARARAQLKNQTYERIRQLTSELSTAKNQLQNEIESRSESETSANETVAELQASLERATISIQDETRARKLDEQRAREQIEHISTQLAEAEATKEDFSQRLQTREATETQVNELRTALIDAKAHLEQEIDLHSTADIEYESQVKTLLEQLNSARAISEQESSSRVVLEDKLDRLTVEFEETHQVLQTQLASSQQQVSAIQLEADKLAEELVETQSTAEQNKKERDEIAENSRLQVETLQLVLGNAQRQANEEAKQREESLNTSGNDQLSDAETSLANDVTLQQESGKLRLEVDSLKTALTLTEEKLAGEAESRNRVEQYSGNQIESLIDEVNPARAAAKREAETRAEIDKETQRKIDAIAAELREARTTVKADASTRIELDQANEFAKETSQLLSEAESRVKEIELEKEATEKRVLANKNALDEARAEAKQNAKSEQAARQEIEQLVASASAASPESASSDANLAEGDNTPIHSSRDMSNPILRSMVERFIVRLSQHLDVMDNGIQQENYLELVVIGNWIKSEAFKLGFSEFDPLVSALELCLRQKDFDSIPNIIGQLRKLDLRIEIQEVPVDDGSSLGVKPQSIEGIKISLPVGEKNAELLENFVSQLGSKLLGMQSAWDYGNSGELEKACRWILRYAVKLQLPVVISATEELQSAIKHGDADRISQKLWNFIGLYSHIELERKP
ncbi:MAG: hypothetical protein O6945_06085, partial [Gammaproteobacteria bacterium]|nr:hypothetical protein [Gammaproteobacteria bacterium]